MKKEKSKNLIVIIGNGFDLAHGMKTRFSDFADYYIYEVILKEIYKAKENKTSTIFNDEFLSILNSSHQQNYGIDINSSVEEKIKTLCYWTSLGKKLKNMIIEIISCSDEIIPNIISNSFLSKLYSDSYENWFDIEQAYYKELVLIHNSSFRSSKKRKKLVELNNNLCEIRDSFQDYLFKIEYHKDKNVYTSLKTHFKERESVCYINFNYTYTVEKYHELIENIDLKQTLKRIDNIHIHGQVQQDIVFGYGDDTDQYYQEMKSTKEKEYLRNFKTFEYLGRHEYRQVLNELAIHDHYDVLIIGHSLDTTDRTILKAILDTEKCQYIELLKRSDLEGIDEQNECHFELHANLSRIFENETDLREKVIPSIFSINFPVMTAEDLDIIERRNVYLYNEKKGFDLRFSTD